MATKLILIRHGQTQWNLQKRYSGIVDVSLNGRGKKQAQELHRRLKKEVIHKVYSSDRKRAQQTANIIFKKAAIVTVPDLRELHFGIFEGLTYKKIMKNHSEIYKRWLNDPFRVSIPEGESFSDFKKRVRKAFKKIIALNRNKTIAVICHGGTISMFINSIKREKNFWKHIPSSASMSIIEFKNGKAGIKQVNDTSHLSR